jgi:hypothetical protein
VANVALAEIDARGTLKASGLIVVCAFDVGFCGVRYDGVYLSLFAKRVEQSF